MMKEQEFVAQRSKDWDRLQQLLHRAETSLKGLRGDELVEFSRLHRRVSGDLAAVRTQGTNPSLLAFLNDLVARSAAVLYTHPRKPLFAAARDLALDAARAVRRRSSFILLAIGVTVLFGAAAWFLTAADPRFVDVAVPADFRDSLEHWKTGRFEDTPIEGSIAGTAFYIFNNTIATILVAAGGMTFGLSALYALFQNGVILGVFLHEVQGAGALGHFITGVVPHGVTELGGVFVGAGGGFTLAWAMINPGRKSIAASLRDAGKDAALLIAMGIIMIWIAAPIEAWFSFQASVPAAAKQAVAILTFILWMVFFSLAGRGEADASQQ